MKDKLYHYKATIREIVDGDSIKVTVEVGFDAQVKIALRILDIDAPETRTTNLEEKERGKESEQWLRDTIEGKTLYIRTQEKDSFGRWLADVFVEESDGFINVGDKMVEKGYAVVYDE